MQLNSLCRPGIQDPKSLPAKGHDIHKILHFQITLPYCAEEEHWTLQQFSLFQKAFHKVGMGRDLLNEFIFFSHDVPISKQFVQRLVAVFAERFRNLLQHMEELSLLSPRQKKRAVENCVFQSVAIFVAKLESCENGYQQLKFAVGSEGSDLTYTREILKLINGRKLKKMCMENVIPSTCNLDQESIQHFVFLLSRVIPLVKDMAVMKLMIFVLLFKELAEDDDQTCVAIQQRYLTLLLKKLAHLRKSKPQDEVNENNGAGENLSEYVVSKSTKPGFVCHLLCVKISRQFLVLNYVYKMLLTRCISL